MEAFGYLKLQHNDRIELLTTKSGKTSKHEKVIVKHIEEIKEQGKEEEEEANEQNVP